MNRKGLEGRVTRLERGQLQMPHWSFRWEEMSEAELAHALAMDAAAGTLFGGRPFEEVEPDFSPMEGGQRSVKELTEDELCRVAGVRFLDGQL